jgi:uncharacterized protein (DUF1810 family)
MTNRAEPAGSLEGLARFVEAQQGSHSQALAELRAGCKQTHWIWYVLPQLRGLGRSELARRYGIADREEAAAYMAHPVLGPRLVECVQATLAHRDRSAVEILGEVDALKYRSCLTLFSQVSAGEGCFDEALTVFYAGQPDIETLRLLGIAAP